MNVINTDDFSTKLRAKAIDLTARKLLISRITGSEQEQDLSEPANCDGFGRIRHFKRQTSPGWPENPLPIEPAAKKLGIPAGNLLRAQVFQNSACNWRCWYCYVPFNLLAADPNRAAWLSSVELIDLYQNCQDPPQVIDLSGGQPDLTPEWIPWMMEELRNRGVHELTYLWSDDNLSNDYFWRFLTADQIKLVCDYRNYGKVCCFKGFDSTSFGFNTSASPELFDRQFELFARYLGLGIDLYAYATFTCPREDGISDAMRVFVDRLQRLHKSLPLRTVPLEIRSFSPMGRRMQPIHESAIHNQKQAISCWNKEIEARFSPQERQRAICDVPLTGV